MCPYALRDQRQLAINPLWCTFFFENIKKCFYNWYHFSTLQFICIYILISTYISFVIWSLLPGYLHTPVHDMVVHLHITTQARAITSPQSLEWLYSVWSLDTYAEYNVFFSRRVYVQTCLYNIDLISMRFDRYLFLLQWLLYSQGYLFGMVCTYRRQRTHHRQMKQLGLSFN